MDASKPAVIDDYAWLSDLHVDADHQAWSADSQTDCSAVFAAYYTLELVLGKVVGGRHYDGSYHHIPSANSRFVAKLKTAIEHCRKRNPEEKPSFLDVGCGLGVKMLIARNLGCRVGGIELNQKYAEIAELMLVQREVPVGAVYSMDAFEFKDYDRYNIIYWYTPLDDSVKMNELEQTIFNAALPGTILIPILNTRSTEKYGGPNPSGVIELDEEVFLKK